MPLPKVTQETMQSLSKAVEENKVYHLDQLTKLSENNPILYKYLDRVIAMMQNNYSHIVGDEVASIVGMVLGILEHQADSDEMAKQFELEK